MKQTLSILFSLIILAQPMNNLRIMISFEINREYIRNFLCEKKSDPLNCCKGSCWLEKELAGAGEDQPEPLQPNRIEIPECNYILQSASSLLKPYCNMLNVNYSICSDQNRLDGFEAAVFHPPELTR